MLRRLVLGLCVVTILSALPIVSGCASDDADSAIPTLADPNATGRELATEFVTILQSGDRAALDAFLDESFQIQRADGSGGNRVDYLAKPAKV